MAKFKKPTKLQKERQRKREKKPTPFGGLEANPRPEARPVKPKLPGSRDLNVIQRQRDIDQKESSRFLQEAALKRKGKKPQNRKTKSKARAAKPKGRSKRRRA